MGHTAKPQRLKPRSLCDAGLARVELVPFPVVELKAFMARLKPRPFKAARQGNASEQQALFEALDRRGFVIFHVEDGVQFGDLQQVVHLLGEVE